MRFLMTMLLVLIPLCAQDTPPPQKGRGGGGPPKNLKILKPEEVNATMRAFTQSLGVRCNFCHVQGDNASDENPKKNVARMMLTMVHDINGKFPQVDGKTYVTCYTCHRGKDTPETTPPPPAPGGGQ
jgi:hypothetical protein